MADYQNTGCLKGIACPQCGHHSGFTIDVDASAYVTDAGYDDERGYGFGDFSTISCNECYYQGLVADFRGDDPASPADLAARRAVIATFAPFGVEVDANARTAHTGYGTPEWALVAVSQEGGTVELTVKGLTPAQALEMLAVRDTPAIPGLLAALRAAPTDSRTG